MEYVGIGDTIYVVVAKEQNNVTETPLSIMKRLVNRHANDEKRTRYLLTNGDNRYVRYVRSDSDK